MASIFLSIFICIFSIAPFINALYIPGVAPNDYKDNEPIDVKVVKLDSVKTQLPYDYYWLPFCRPQVDGKDAIIPAAENLGEVLSGDKIENSLYTVYMKKEVFCQVVCKKIYTDDELAQFSTKIEEEYRVNWILDNIPAATKYFTQALPSDESKESFVPHYEKGFALGFVGHIDMQGSQPGVKYINNHLRLVILYHEEQTYKGARVVGFEVEAYSIKHEWNPDKSVPPDTCMKSDSAQEIKPQRVSDIEESDHNIVFTYDVVWKRSDIKWAMRWDVYLKMTDSKIHWFSIINSIMIVLFLSGMVAVIMLRILHRDLARYNNEQMSEEEQKEETGWKLIHGDVFRPPAHGGWFAVLVGTGAQIFAMTLITLVFAALGFLSPANRGGLMTALLLLFVFMGMLAGYYSTRTYKMFGLLEWKKNTLATALLFPGLVFGVFFILNFFVWGEHSSGAVPFSTLVALLVLWLGISVPLVYLGSYIAFRKPNIEHPVKINNLCRLLPPDSQQSWYTSPHLSILLGGILPFAAVFIEIFFIMSSVWLNQFYYVFGFLFIVFIILIITCAEITIVLCYFQLCNEDYHWWWRSYLTPGSSALYLFLYSILYFFTKLQIVKFTSGLLFFGYMFLVCCAFFVLTGTIGYFACFAFVTKIYASIKID